LQDERGGRVFPNSTRPEGISWQAKPQQKCKTISTEEPLCIGWKITREDPLWTGRLPQDLIASVGTPRTTAVHVNVFRARRRYPSEMDALERAASKKLLELPQFVVRQYTETDGSPPIDICGVFIVT